MTVFDRSWYGRLLVERVEGLIDKETAKRSGQEIVEFERLLVDNDVTLVKFWLHLSDEQQLKRFKDRESDPLKQWKLTPEDWRNREKRGAYLDALKDMVEMTDKPTRTGPHSLRQQALLARRRPRDVDRALGPRPGAARPQGTEATKWRLSQLVPREDSVARGRHEGNGGRNDERIGS